MMKTESLEFKRRKGKHRNIFEGNEDKNEE